MGVIHHFFGRFVDSCNRAKFLTISCSLLAVLGNSACAEEVDATGVPAVIMRVEGEGIAKVKKAIGTEEVAGANGKIFPGDRVITDDKSSVFLMINDGSVIKVGLSSEFKVEQTKMHERFMSWAFGLVKGSMRAMVEKNPNPDVRFRVNTPSGTIGVRGTEFVVAVDEGSNTSHLYTIEGLVSFGAASCEANNSCIDVRAGETASLKVGERQPAKPQAFQVKDLFGVAGAAAKPAVADNRMSLFRDAKKVTSRFMQDTDDAALAKLLKDASEAMASNQDQAIGRSLEERVAMNAAIKDGSFGDVMAAADAYSSQNDIFNPATNGGAENLVGQTVAAKFRLGAAVKEAVATGVFDNPKGDIKDPKVKWAATDLTKARKNVEYENEDKAKAVKSKLADVSEDFKKVLELAEAHSEKSVQENSADGQQEAPEKKVVEKKAYICDKSCKLKTVTHEVHAMSEGVVEAFNEAPAAKAESEKVNPGRLTKRDRGTVRSKYFRKAIPGNACYNEVKDCKMVPCKGAASGRTCKKGESVKTCTTKRTQVRCRKNG